MELFLRNLLCDEHHELHNRTLHVNKRYKDYQKPDIQTVKPDNQSAFHSSDYDRKIQQTIPYYHEFYEQVTELVEVFHHHAIRWLAIGCGTGKMEELSNKTGQEPGGEQEAYRKVWKRVLSDYITGAYGTNAKLWI